MRAFIAVLAFAAIASATSVPFTNCGSSSDKFTINSIDATPYPPTKGKSVTVKVDGTLGEDVTAATYDITVKYSGIQLYHGSGDGCQFIGGCPLKSGAVDRTVTQTLPSIAPAGTYDVQLKLNDQSGTELTCTDIKLEIAKASSLSFDFTNSKAAPEEGLEAANGLECDACKFVVNELDSFLEKDDNLVNQTEALLEQDVCKLLPSQYQGLCDVGVTQYVPQLFSYIENTILTGDFVCPKIGLCSSSVMLGTSLECTVCEKLVGYVDSFIEGQTVEGFVAKELDAICGVLPKGAQALCDAAVQSATPKVLAFIANELSQSCKAIHLCK